MFVPELSHIEKISATNVFVTTEGIVGTAYKMPIIDLESFELNPKFIALEQIIETLSPDIVFRIRTEFNPSNDIHFENSRHAAIKEHGFLDEKVFLFFEMEKPSLHLFKNKTYNNIEKLVSLLPEEALKTLGAIPLREEEIREEFLLPHSDVTRHKHFLDFGSNVIGVLRLYKQGTIPLSEESLARLLQLIPLPYSITTTIKKIPTHVTEFKLRSKFAKESVSDDPNSDKRILETRTALEETTLKGTSQVKIEWLLTLKRYSEDVLRLDLMKALSNLKPLGDLMIETFGCVKSFRATLAGSRQHFTFIEYDKSSIVFLPLFAFGESLNDYNPPRRALLLHREDGSIHLFDQFSDNFLAYNVIISGKTGSGKSVLANALSQALLSDPNILMVKIDVGGSYSKECKLYGGTEINFSLDKPSGINPFRFLSDLTHSNEAIDIVTKLISTLIREEGEVAIPKSLVVQIENELKSFVSSKNNEFSIDGFYKWSKNIPRKELLSRWVKNGVFENALKENGKEIHSQYRYYNFESIQSAANTDYAEGIMAAVIAQVNLEMLRLGQSSNKRLILFCDETNFFIEKNAQFFLLTTANFRKFGHGVILITQKLQNFEIPSHTSKPDNGIILNSPIRFFLEQDTEKEYLKNTFRLLDSHLQRIIDSPYRGKEYREFVLQDDTGTKIVRLYLSANEYWRMTSTKEDNEKINALQKLVPHLSLEEAIKCISLQ